MSWIRPTLYQIYERIRADMQSYVTDGIPVPLVSLLGVFDKTFSGALHLQYGFLEWIKKQIFIDTATGYGRTRWSRILNIPRRGASYSTGYVSFTGTAAEVVASGTVVINAQGYEFETQDTFTIGTDTEVQVQAVTAGAEYNHTDSTLTLNSPDPDIDSDVLIEDYPVGETPFQDGTDIESIESWVLRMLQRFQNPPGSGNAGDYVRWATSRPGVGKAWCVPAEIFGQGSVGVYVAGVSVATDTTPAGLVEASAAVLADVEDYIEGVRPIPALVSYGTITPVEYIFYISITPNNADLQKEIHFALGNLFLTESGPGNTIYISHIRDAIKTAGINNYVINLIKANGAPVATEDIDSIYPNTPVYVGTYFSELSWP